MADGGQRLTSWGPQWAEVAEWGLGAQRQAGGKAGDGFWKEGSRPGSRYFALVNFSAPGALRTCENLTALFNSRWRFESRSSGV